MRLGLVALVGMSIVGLSYMPAQASKNSRHPSHGGAAHHSFHHHGSRHNALRHRVSLGRQALRVPDGAGVDEIRELIAKHAAANGVPFKLADAVVRIESTYKPNVSNGGALGLMQIKPGTARELGFVGSEDELYGAETNVQFGMKYLAQVYRQSGGDICGTVMRYQSGAYTRHMNAANRAYCSKARAIMASN
jgi:soluble lytic murein transglycosylase-like protein